MSEGTIDLLVGKIKELEQEITTLKAENRKQEIYINHLHTVDQLLEDIICEKCSDNFFNGDEPKRCLSCEIKEKDEVLEKIENHLTNEKFIVFNDIRITKERCIKLAREGRES